MYLQYLMCEEIAPDVLAAASAAAEIGSGEIGPVADSSLSSASSTHSDSPAYISTPLTSASEGPSQPLPSKLTAALFEKTDEMSFGQSRIWLPYIYLEERSAYNCTTSYRLKGPLDIPRLEKSLELVTQRHQSFRTAFYTELSTGKAMQAVMPSSHFKLETISTANDSEDVTRTFQRIASHTFDLESGDTFIATLLTHGPQYHTIVFGYHHIIMDGVSWQLFLQDMEEFYSPMAPIVAQPSQYLQFSTKQRQLAEKGAHSAERTYWKKEFSDLPSALPLFPFAKASARKPLVRYTTLDSIVFLSSDLMAKIKKVTSNAKTTNFHFFLSVLQALMYRFLEVDDLCIGITDAGRTDQAFLETIGFLLNMLPLRFKLESNQSFLDTLRNTRKKAYSALGNSAVSFHNILQDLNVPASPTDLPLFQILVNYRMGSTKQNTIGDVRLDWLDYEDAKHPFDFTLSIDEMEDGKGALSLSMQDYLYDKEGSDLLLSTYIHLLDAFASDPSQGLDDVSLFDQTEIDRAITLGTGPNTSQAWPETLSLRLDALVKQQPDAIAVKDLTGTHMTYLQISAKANAIASALHNVGATAGSYVASYLEATADVICSMLAIMRLGAVYIPLDTRLPKERLKAIIAESGADTILFHAATADRLRSLEITNARVFDVSTASSTNTGVPNKSKPTAPAFILFTSGSTGKPKGITLTNANFLTHIAAATESMQIGKEVVLQQSALGFDASLAQIFYALANGGTLIMASNRGDMSDLAALMQKEKVTFTLCVPSEYSVLLQYGSTALRECKSWRVAMCGGEAFAANLREKFRDINLPHLEIFNAYGPTEISVASSIGKIPYREETFVGDFKVPIGPAIPNYGVYLLDETSQPVPLGWPGEISIAGPAVSSGYLNNHQLTTEKFVPNNIVAAKQSLEGWKTLYHSGDKGRMLKDGSIVYLGRMNGDSQIKLRGIRIELTEISNAILERSGGAVADAAVTVRGDTNQYLVAYVVFTRQRLPQNSPSYLRQLLVSLPLPTYMRPAFAISLDHFPTTNSGKLDTRALQILPLPQSSQSDDSPLSDTELQLKEVWQSLLSGEEGDTEISRDSDFFSVGGNSLLLLRMQAEIRRIFHTEIALVDLFQNNTLASLASRLDDSESVSLLAKLDWTTESSLTSDILAINRGSTRQRAPGSPLTVLLTGSTGFLGGAILEQLVNNSNIGRVRCIAIRSSGGAAPRQHAVASEKIESYTGDLSLPFLGMSEEDFSRVFQDADVLIHNGADVSFLKSYHSLRAPNVTSTKELAQLALRHDIPFHFVSTGGVAHLSGKDSFGEESVSAYLPPVDGSDGYVASKWASERYLENVNESLGLPVYIHRPSSIIGEDAPSLDILHNTLKYSRLMKAIPDLTGAEGYFDFIAVDSVARGIVSHVLSRQKLPAPQSPTYIHHSGETVVPMTGMKEHLERTEGNAYRVLGMQDWVDAAVERGLNPLVATYLGTAQREGKSLAMPLLTKSQELSA